MRLIDLSVPLRTGMPVYPGDPQVDIRPALTAARDGVNVLRVHIGSQSGTHVDAPSHIEDGLSALDQLPLDRFDGPAHVVDARGLPPRAAIGADLLAAVPEGRIVLVATGWSAHWGTAAYHDHPYLTPEAAELLVARGVRTVGVDALSVDPTPGETLPAHRVLCGADAVIAENLTNLAEVLDAQLAGHAVHVSLFPLHLPGADGAPVRAVARIPEPQP
ncbi:cyclase family protein [Streptomyces arenae]|uniref:cyclase family protein n=1 Tax=Streptomyces arenae TaxID=29301 RepID=UPI00265A4854|nr:cyclase family protein [Streptomyces arenae]MCG7210813.1 cyclase family protein [Streptomyces arenae]